MAETPSATLNGYKLLGSSPIQWVFTDGVQPYEATFDVMPSDLPRIMAGAKDPQTLIIDSKVGPKLTVDYLSLRREVPSDNPNVKRILVSDRRWLLPYYNFLGRFNMRRNVGYQRVGNNVTSQLNPVVSSVWYWPWSLRSKIPWKASEILTEFMKQLGQWETNEGYAALGFLFSSKIQQLDSKLSPDNLNIDESGDMSLMRIMSMYPNVSVYVNAEGKYVFFDRNDRSEGAAVVKLGPVVVGGGQLQKSDLRYERPNRIEVFFTVEAEVRHDFIGDLGTVTEDTRYLENVAPVPDFELTIGSTQYAQGSWAPLNQMMEAWPIAPGIGTKLNGQLLEKAALPYLDLWSALELTGSKDDPDADWAARAGVCAAHHRTSFQLAAAWMMRTLSIKARRCAVINPTTGTWAPSEAYCDHSFIGTTRSKFKSLNESSRMEFCVNVEGYPTGGQVPGTTSPIGAKSFTRDSKPAPVLVRILDGDQGVIHLDFQAEKNHIYEAALPGLIAKADNTVFPPTANWKTTDGQRSIGYDMVTDRAQIPKLKNQWKCAVILTHTPAAPNNKNQLYKISVEPKDVRARLSNVDLGPCEGPTWQIRVGAGMDGAKALVRWLDSRAVDIEALFGIGDKEPNLAGLVMNHDVADTSTSKEISLTEIAQSLAAQVYSRFIDGYQGFGVGYMNPDVKPGGRVAHVSHTLTPKGEMYTELQMHESAPEIPYLSMLDSSTRAVLLKLPHVERQ